MAILSTLAMTVEGMPADFILYGPLVVLQLAAFVGVAAYEGRRRVSINNSPNHFRRRNHRHSSSVALKDKK